MKRQSRTMRLGVLALTLTMITTCLTGGTLARYVTEVTGSATAVVAKWSFNANDTDTDTETEKTEFSAIEMGSTANRTSYDGTDIKKDVIAPGTTGSFDIVIDGTGSEVGIDYEVKIAAGKGTDGKTIELPDDLKFSTAKITDDTQGVKIGEFTPTTENGLKGTIAYKDGEAAMKKTITVYWSWAFDEGNDKDTNDNKYAGKTWTLDITATGKQTKPETGSAP